MGKSWDGVRARLDKITDDPKGRSNKYYLSDIFDKAELWEIDPGHAYEASISNLREIIREARKAIAFRNKERLEELFIWAADFGNKELRFKLRELIREIIEVKVIPDLKGPLYRMELTQPQFERIKRATELQYDFELINKQDDNE